MSKEIENKICPECESSYRLVYDPQDTSGYSKFCPFCGAEHDDEVDRDEVEEDDE